MFRMSKILKLTILSILLFFMGCSKEIKYVYVEIPKPLEPKYVDYNFNLLEFDNKKFYCLNEDNIDSFIFNMLELKRIQNTNYEILKKLNDNYNNYNNLKTKK